MKLAIVGLLLLATVSIIPILIRSLALVLVGLYYFTYDSKVLTVLVIGRLLQVFIINLLSFLYPGGNMSL